MPPLANGPGGNFAEVGNNRRSAESVNDRVRIHAEYLSRLRLEKQPTKIFERPRFGGAISPTTYYAHWWILSDRQSSSHSPAK